MPPKSTPLTQGIAIIRLMVQSGHSLGVTGIAQTLKMPKSSVYRVLQGLQSLGFVERLESARYTLRAEIFEFVHEIARNFGRNLRLDEQLRTAAHRLNCSVYLSVLGARDTYVICAAGEEGNTARLGIHSRAYATSAGKVLIAQKAKAHWPNYSPKPEDIPITPFTNRSPRKFLAELQKVKKAGIAWNHRESSPDHVSLATTVQEPFIPKPRLAVALVMRCEVFETWNAKDLEAALLELSAMLERELGAR